MAAKELALVIHFHQPVGNLDAVVRQATDRCYRPFLEVLEKHPEVPVTLHYSGCLLEWLEANASDVTERLAGLVRRGQVELMTGGFYEPILAALPARDQIGQIRLLTDHLAADYRTTPRGVWLTERVWEQEVVASLADAGAAYTVVDDTMLHAVGIEDDQLTGPFVTDHDGKPLLLYAGDRTLRYLVPYKRTKRVTDYLSAVDDGRLVVYADDGEKFGEWPDTYERVYDKGWLSAFFKELTAQREWLRLTTLGEHSKGPRPVGRVYLPSSSYDEMMTWALPTDARLVVGRARRALAKKDPTGILPFVKGAPWRAFIAKYPEVNQLHKRMLHVSGLVEAAGSPPEATRELYKAQCNCAYWHGSFGGLFLGFMRTALWHHLMRGEVLARAALPPAPPVEVLDLDADTLDDVILTAPWGAAVIAVFDGRIVELDDWGIGANLLATALRHREAYHLEDENPPDPTEDDEMAAAQPRVEVDRDSLVFDDHLRGVVDLIDDKPMRGPYDYDVVDQGMVRLWSDDDELRVAKAVSADAEELITLHTLTNLSGTQRSGSFGIEASVLPLNLGRGVPPDIVEHDRHRWLIHQAECEVALEASFSEPAEVSFEAIATSSATLEGLEEMRQGTAVTTTWAFDLAPQESWSVELRWKLILNEGMDKKERGVSA
ncbi:MAG: alpha-amylase/4-alpha-glucanotransferase domain-containing protein [Actinomycetota bacterium]